MIQLKPNYADAYCYRGICHANLEDYQGAIADFSQAIEINPNCVIAYNARGNVRSTLGDEKQAGLDFQTATELEQQQGKIY